MSNVEALEIEYRATDKEVGRIESEIAAEIRAATAAIRAANRDRLNTAATARSEAKAALDDAKIAAAAQNPLVGRKMQKTSRRFVNRWSSKQETVTTFGILEIRTAETEFPANMRYGLPQIGALFIRICKKDGSAGTRIDTNYRPWEEAK